MDGGKKTSNFGPTIVGVEAKVWQIHDSTGFNHSHRIYVWNIYLHFFGEKWPHEQGEMAKGKYTVRLMDS